jgi:hypothetical protein
LREVCKIVVVSAALGRDAEERRWYSESAEACLVLTRRGRLLEPDPVFGPNRYRLLARRVSVREATAYALAHGFRHERIVSCPNRTRLRQAPP